MQRVVALSRPFRRHDHSIIPTPLLNVLMGIKKRNIANFWLTRGLSNFQMALDNRAELLDFVVETFESVKQHERII